MVRGHNLNEFYFRWLKKRYRDRESGIKMGLKDDNLGLNMIVLKFPGNQPSYRGREIGINSFNFQPSRNENTLEKTAIV